jgi:glyoxylase-like metal-dependent hydrolase (beta-lactamase superfamily II)/rhodanese-related sulfurtransferase
MAIAEITVDELRAALTTRRPLSIVDVRPSDERAEWAIPGSRHVDAYADLKNGDDTSLARGVADLPHDRPVVAVCARGRTSLLAARALDALGFEALSLKGGMTAWSSAWNTAVVPLPERADCRILQIRRTGKGCLSYLLASDCEAAVVDPSLDPAIYIRLAAERGWRIVAVLDTHVHADHVTHAARLAAAARSPVYLPANPRVRSPFTPLDDGDRIEIGKAEITALRTPGHTPESTCYGFGRRALCTGDTLFLTSVGRPDLEASGDEPRERARLLYRSLNDRLWPLPDDLIILPGHASAPVPFDSAPLAASLGEVRRDVTLAALGEEAFVDTVLARIPPTPPNHHRIVQINEGLESWPGDMRTLEAGANRCAVGK